MSDALLVSTRKGLFTVARNAGQWKIAGVEFLGDNVTLTLTDPTRRAVLRGARSRAFRGEAAPLDPDGMGGNCGSRLSAQAGRL